MFGLLQRRRPQQQTARSRSSIRRPAVRDFAKLRVLPDPVDVGRKRFDKAVRAHLELRIVVKEDEVEACERFGNRLVVHASPDDRREAFVERSRERDLLLAHFRRNCVRAQYHHDRVCLHDQCLNALPPVLECVNFAAID